MEDDEPFVRRKSAKRSFSESGRKEYTAVTSRAKKPKRRQLDSKAFGRYDGSVRRTGVLRRMVRPPPIPEDAYFRTGREVPFKRPSRRSGPRRPETARHVSVLSYPKGTYKWWFSPRITRTGKEMHRILLVGPAKGGGGYYRRGSLYPACVVTFAPGRMRRIVSADYWIVEMEYNRGSKVDYTKAHYEEPIWFKFVKYVRRWSAKTPVRKYYVAFGLAAPDSKGQEYIRRHYAKRPTERARYNQPHVWDNHMHAVRSQRRRK